MAPRLLVQLTDHDLEVLIEHRLTVALAELQAEPAPALLDRQGLAKALSCSTKTLDRLRAEPNFPELQLLDSPRFELPNVLAWIRTRNAGQGLRVVASSGKGGAR